MNSTPARLVTVAALSVGLVLGGCATSGTPPPEDVGARIESSAPAPVDSALTSTSPTARAPDRVRAEPPRALTLHRQTARVVPVGIDSAQRLEIPGDIHTLGWWQGGAKPGAVKGFVVITGHATREGDGAANTWWSARPGDRIAVKTPRGTVHYRVVSRKTYDKDEIPLARWFPFDGPAGPAGLALITCADYRDGAWQANTVVEAVPT